MVLTVAMYQVKLCPGVSACAAVGVYELPLIVLLLMTTALLFDASTTRSQ